MFFSAYNLGMLHSTYRQIKRSVYPDDYIHNAGHENRFFEHIDMHTKIVRYIHLQRLNQSWHFGIQGQEIQLQRRKNIFVLALVALIFSPCSVLKINYFVAYLFSN